MAKEDRRKMAPEEVERIAGAVAEVVIKQAKPTLSDEDVDRIVSAFTEKHREICKNCSEEGVDRHHDHHALLDRWIEMLDRLDNAKWKVGTGVAIIVLGVICVAIAVWVTLHTIGVDLRRWHL